MGRRYKKRKRKSKWKFSIQDLFKSTVTFTLRVIPAFIVVGLGILSFVGVRNALYADTQLQISNIQIIPSSALAPPQKKWLESKFLGQNLLLVDLESISQKLQSNPEIRSARVSREFPTQLKIVIDSREPMAAIRFVRAGDYLIVSDDAKILDFMKRPPMDILLMEALSQPQRKLDVGGEIQVEGYQDAVDFVTEFNRRKLNDIRTISKLTFDASGNIAIYLGASPEIRLGRFPMQRFALLEKVLHLIDSYSQKNIQYIDIQFGRVIVKNKGA